MRKNAGRICCDKKAKGACWRRRRQVRRSRKKSGASSWMEERFGRRICPILSLITIFIISLLHTPRI